MKPLLFLALFALFFAGSCKKDEPPKLELPPYSQHGNNIVACKINGEIFIAEGKENLNSWSGNGTYFSIYNDSNIYITASDDKNFKAEFGFHFDFLNIRNISILKNEEKNSAYLYMPVPNKQLAETKFTTDSIYTGAVEVKYFQNGIIAGTFQFDATDGEGNIVHVTEGRFDMKF